MLQIKNFFKRKQTSLTPQGTADNAATPSVPGVSEQASHAPSRLHSARQTTGPADGSTGTGNGVLKIDCPNPTAEESARDGFQQTGQRLVRQENWAALSQRIREYDLAGTLTSGLMPVADLIAFGARADVVLAAEHAIRDSDRRVAKEVLTGIEEFEHVLEEHPDDYIIACIVAQAHIDIGWAWRGTGWDQDIARRNRDAFEAHLARADDIITPFLAQHANSPLLAATHCAQVSGPASKDRVADRYEHLIDLNPLNPGPMRAMGNHLLPRWFGSYAQLELEARRTAARTQQIWGAGGYTWVQFDAISCDDEACANLDLPFFIDGLHDILGRNQNAYTANLLAAYCANTIGQGFTGNDKANAARAQIAGCTEWIVREHLTELHPMVWAHAAHGFDNNLRISSPRKFAAAGRDDAMRIMAGLFKSEIAAGKHIVFTEDGPQAHAF
ncbi:hypothetical protein SAMN04488040_1744 [Sulfitobacter marinus]|uniref:Uncharacterized protein n=1 Tax=Sulfitobacter marinus TaxID=394264 RepID=A0A1I6S5J2_9RHOB|nr:hypothetical protein [Sulfitobacter marinus]SFS72173.1 hypothetical protein SAMN04488040_1744 [Sulfitobacter marinus]